MNFATTVCYPTHNQSKLCEVAAEKHFVHDLLYLTASTLMIKVNYNQLLYIYIASNIKTVSTQ